MLRDLAETLPLLLPADINTTPIHSGYFGDHSSQESSDAATDDSSPEGRSFSNSLSSGSTPMAAFSSAGNAVAISIGDNEITRFVFVLVLDSRYHLITTDVSDMTSRDFFQALTAGYNAHRGILRRMFSIFAYSHCDFVQVRSAPKGIRRAHLSPLDGGFVSFLSMRTAAYPKDTKIGVGLLLLPVLVRLRMSWNRRDNLI
jgi:hypothetical protein